MTAPGEGYPYYYAPQRYNKPARIGEKEYSTDKYEIYSHHEIKPLARNCTKTSATLIIEALNSWHDIKPSAAATAAVKRMKDAKAKRTA